jgi:hypothetical protein
LITPIGDGKQEVAALRKDEQFRALVRDRGMNVEIDPLQPHTWRPHKARDAVSHTPITRETVAVRK